MRFESNPDLVVCNARAACVQRLEDQSAYIWVALSSSLLVSSIGDWLSHRRSDKRLGHLVLLEPPDHSRVPLLRSIFTQVTGDETAYRFLPRDELLDVLTAPRDERQDLFIGGMVDTELRAVVLVRGDLRPIVVPLSSFKPAGGTTPDPDGFAVTDYGQTVKLGQYESANDAILYRLDADYRRRLRARRRAEDKGFGPSLRRLRKQRGMKRTDFAGVSEKTIARIERGESQPGDRTLALIEEQMGLSADEIETY